RRLHLPPPDAPLGDRSRSPSGPRRAPLPLLRRGGGAAQRAARPDRPDPRSDGPDRRPHFPPGAPRLPDDRPPEPRPHPDLADLIRRAARGQPLRAPLPAAGAPRAPPGAGGDAGGRTVTWRAEIGGIEVLFGANLVDQLGALAAELGGGRIILVTDPGVRA